MTKPKTSIDEAIEGMLKDDSAQTEAVRSLIKVADTDKSKLGSDIELKTDLDSKEVCLHTAVDMMSRFLDMLSIDFESNSIISELVTTKERKLLSKDRKSRQEIVEIARTPETPIISDTGQNQGAVRRFFTSRKNRQ